MRSMVAAITTCALLLLPAVLHAADTPAPGAANGTIIGGSTTGMLADSPIRTAVWPDASTVGASVSPPPRDDVIVEQRSVPLARERNCIRDAMGHVVCDQPR